MTNIGARGRAAAILVAGALFFVWAGVANAVPPPPSCFSPQITDVKDDGHHTPTDLKDAWFSEANGLQAVMRIHTQDIFAEHDEAEVVGAGLAMLFTGKDGKVWFVRGVLPEQGSVEPAIFDYGTYTPGGLFASEDTTPGVYEPGPPGGSASVTIDIPAAAVSDGPNPVLNDPFVLSYDGRNTASTVYEWVDRAPGGTPPGDTTTTGPDYTVGCGAAVSLGVSKLKLLGKSKVTVSGTVLPAAPGVNVDIVRTSFGKVVTTPVTTAADGSFSVRVTVNENTKIHAIANGLDSTTLTVTMRPIVKIKFRKLKNGKKRIVGTTNPALPGKLLLLRTTAFKATATKAKFKGGTFKFTFAKLKPGRFQVVYVPRSGRAERAVSNVARVR